MAAASSRRGIAVTGIEALSRRGLREATGGRGGVFVAFDVVVGLHV